MKASTGTGALWVCWTKPWALPDEQHPILSFLSPADEDEISKLHRGITLSAREESLKVRGAARDLYIELVARIGIVRCASGLTFRQSICPPGEASPWWYHRVAFKDCETDPTFEWIVAVSTIRKLADEHGLKQLVLVGAPHQIAQTLRSEFSIEESGTRPEPSAAAICVRGIASRVKYAATALRQLQAVRRRIVAPQKRFDVALCSFWDWSVFPDDRADALTDRYFKQLPGELMARGASVGWFAWFDPDADPDKQGRSLSEVLNSLNGRNEIVILQTFLRPSDILRAVIEFQPFRAFVKLRKQNAFREALKDSSLDFSPIFIAPLLSGFTDSGLPHQNLVALATERCFRRYAPRAAFSFLEHFPHARAQYEGIRRSKSGTTRFISQHAAYSHEKTFLFMHPALEFRGEPDEMPSPHADYVCAMGSLGEKLFLECGYEPNTALLTGSPRYDHVREPSAEQSPSETSGSNEGGIRVLMVCSLDTNLELEMVDAVCAAARNLPGVKLYLRNHPFRRIEQHANFARYRDQVQLTCQSLENDLAQSDLILFTYSTVADEALLKGKPVWQWLTLRANGSALPEVIDLPQFGSVESLRSSLRDFQRDPDRFKPMPGAQLAALEQLFFKGDGGAARRLSMLCTTDLNKVASVDA